MRVNRFIFKRLLSSGWKSLNEKCCIIIKEKAIITGLLPNTKSIMRYAIVLLKDETKVLWLVYKISSSLKLNILLSLGSNGNLDS
jgi:hypothetical protein